MKTCDVCKKPLEPSKRRSLRISLFEVGTKKCYLRTIPGDYCGKCATDILNSVINEEWSEKLFKAKENLA